MSGSLPAAVVTIATYAQANNLQNWLQAVKNDAKKGLIKYPVDYSPTFAGNTN
jgi:hypothetical protein